MTSVEIAVSCWAGQLDQYARMLTFHLSAFVLHPPRNVDLKSTVFYSLEDKATCQVIEFFRGKLNLDPVPLSLGMLFRRAISRNMVAENTDANVCWLTDVDYLCGEGCLDSLADAYQAGMPHLVYPKSVKIQTNHKIGDRVVSECPWPPEVTDINDTDFTVRRERKAIGGIQIVRGDYLRAKGYLRDSKWMKSVSIEDGFQSCKCDAAWRRTNKTGGGVAIDIPNCYRIRHTKAGRDEQWEPKSNT